MKIDERETRGGLSCSGNNNLWMILQLSDSAFPTGGFVHSGMPLVLSYSLSSFHSIPYLFLSPLISLHSVSPISLFLKEG